VGAKKVSSMFCELQSGTSNNSISNVDASSTPYGITGVSAISVSYSGGDSLKLYAAYSQSDTYNCIYEFSNTSSKTSLSYCPFRFYKFINESGSAIDIASISFTYSCATSSSYISVSDVTAAVNVKSTLSITYSGTSDKALSFYCYDDNIYLSGNSSDGYTVEGLLANTYTIVVAYNASGISTSFAVTVSDEYYDSSASATPAYYDQATWRTATASLSSNGMGTSFAKGVDVSEVQYDEEKGAKYYNRSYKRQDVYQLLKDNGVNTVRIRIWVNPYTTASTPVAYGGGICDTAYVTKMAVRANRVGLKVMLDFHLSDFWTHPAQNILPKAWASYTSTQIASAISSHVTSTLTTLKAAGVTPSMVQIGNEVSDGLYISYPSSTNASVSYTGDGNPYYVQNKTDFTTSSTSSAYLWKISNSSTNQATRITNFRTYLAAGCAAVRSFDSSIKIAIHYAKDLSSDQNFPADWFYNYLLGTTYGSALDFDIVGLSYYPYYHGTIANLATAIANIKAKSTTLATKQYMVLETSFPFTTQYQYGASSWTSNTYPTTSSDVTLNGYSITTSCVAVQAKYYNDLATQLVTSGANGMFIWAGCWVPEDGAGWAGSGTKNTWANQALFTYGGFLTSTLGAVYNQ
jgi:arabinogalactan endo-1,4-beta-galactosidase